MLNKPELLLGSAPESQLPILAKVLSVYGHILNNHKIYNDEIKNKIKLHLNNLKAFPLFVNNQDQIWKELGQK